MTATTQQGDLALLNDPVAQELLQSVIPARLAYTWTDGTPRVVPISFYWTGTEVVLGTPPKAPKLKALPQNPQVALTIDSTTWPYHVLLIRGIATVEMVEPVNPEYAKAMERALGLEASQAWIEQLRATMTNWGRIAIRPTWVGILDFETRFPSALSG